MSLTLQKESPSDQDIFRGEGHERVAGKMAEIISTSDINILGLEGELGSGKSTIIHLLKKKLPPDYTYIDFDAERYHYGNTKKALIEVIHSAISKRDKVNKDLLKEYKDKALGNVLEYEKKVSSRLSWWTVTFILLSLLSVQMIRYLLIDLNSVLTTGKKLSLTVTLVEIVALISPALLLGCFQLYKARKVKKGKVGEPGSIGDLFKRNSTDTISETLLINREIGTLELTDALSGFTAADTVPPDARFILIIDNLDRIPADKVKELWSDMELIAGTTHSQFRIIVPFSVRQVSTSLSVQGHSGREFIAKRFPVTFTVPPLISAGWQDAFIRMWQETVSKEDTASCLESIQLLERWRPVEYPRITPRLLKKLVNDIHILGMTVPGQEPQRFVLLALYVLVVRYNELQVTALLRFTEREEDAPHPGEEDLKMKVTHEQLKRIFGDDTQQWSELLMSIHFQAPAVLARTELFDTPLTEAVKNHDENALEKLAGLYGFSHAWQRCANRMSMYDWLETVEKLPLNTIQILVNEIKSAVSWLDYAYARSEQESFREGFSQSLYRLVQGKHIGLEKFMCRRRDYIVNELQRLQEVLEEDEGFINNLLREADIYSGIFSENLFKKVTDFSGVFYSRYLISNRDHFLNLKISSIYLNDTQQEMMLRHILSHETGDIFGPDALRFIRLMTPAVKRIVDGGNEVAVQSVTDAFSMLQSHILMTDINELRRIIFSSQWYSSNHTQRLSIQKTLQTEHPEEFAAHMVAHLIAIKNRGQIASYASPLIENEKFNHLLSLYLRFMISFSTVMESLSDESSQQYVKEAISQLFNQGQLNYISTQDYMEKFYPTVKENLSDTDPLLPLILREEAAVARVSQNNLEMISYDLINDLFEKNKLLALRTRLISLCQDKFSTKESLYTSFKTIEKNNFLILNKISEKGIHISLSLNTGLFADWYRNEDFNEITEGSHVRFIWSLLELPQQSEILKELHDILFETETLKERRITVIHNFSDVLLFSEPEGKVSRRAIAALFTASLEDDELRSWLNSQKYAFSRWPEDDAETVSKIVNHSPDLFNGVIEGSKFMKRRVALREG